jgi:hypothetical protein
MNDHFEGVSAIAPPLDNAKEKAWRKLKRHEDCELTRELFECIWKAAQKAGGKE